MQIGKHSSKLQRVVEFNKKESRILFSGLPCAMFQYMPRIGLIDSIPSFIRISGKESIKED